MVPALICVHHFANWRNANLALPFVSCYPCSFCIHDKIALSSTFFPQSNDNLAICLYLPLIHFRAGAYERHIKGLNKWCLLILLGSHTYYILRSHSQISKSQFPLREDTAYLS